LEGFLTQVKKGLNRAKAAWATKKYRGHQMFPENLFLELERTGLL
jgi:hypothetical protein